MKKLLLILLVTLLPIAASARYHHGGSHVSVGVGFGGGYAPYYPSYYPAYPAYYAPQPVYVERPVIVREEVYGSYARPAPQQYDERPRYENNDQYCREFTRNVKINGRIQQGYGTACRQPDGSWELDK